MSDSSLHHGLSLAPLRALRFTADDARLGTLLCPPYDVIDDVARSTLLAASPDNAVGVVLPRADAAGHDPYRDAAEQLDRWLAAGVVAVDEDPAIYVYEMRTPAQPDQPASTTRGLVGAVELRDPADGVILPHENTMAGPVADRLALMDATDANLEPIYLVYDGGGAASEVVASVENTDEGGSAYASRHRSDPSGSPELLSTATTPDGITHRLWAVTDAATLSAIAEDLAGRRALIADGHHRYATYRQLADKRTAERGPGPWSRGLALLVDSSAYGPQVHPIHRVVAGLGFEEAVDQARAVFTVELIGTLDEALRQLEDRSDADSADFAVVITDGIATALVTRPDPGALQAARGEDEPTALMDLDVSVLHRVLIQRTWNLIDDEFHVGYAHDVTEALQKATAGAGIAVLCRATPVDAVSAVAAAGARMPRKSTFFTPKPASGLVMRRFADQAGLAD